MSATTKEPHVVALNKAKIPLMSRKDSAFFTHLCFSLKHQWDDTIPTACTDGTKVLYSPKFFMGLTKDQQVFLLLHETLHVAYEHMGRLMNRKMGLWNQACDHVINLMLIARGYVMPEGGLADDRFQDMGAEQVYNILLKEHEQMGCPAPTPGQTMWQDLRPLPKDVDPIKHSEQVKTILVQAALRSKQEKDSPGVVPGDIEIMLRELLNPKLPWNVILMRWLQQFAKNDYSWKRPNRRYFPAWYLPSLYSTRLMNVTIAIDTSGSVSDDDFQRIVSEVAGVFRMVKPDEINLIQFDTEIKSIERIRSIRDLQKCKFSGRGGTDVEPVLDWATLNKPQLLLIFTDGYIDRTESRYTSDRTLWLIHDNNNFTSDFGKVIHYEINA